MNIWKSILNNLKKNNSLFNVTKSLLLGKVEIINNKKIIIYLDLENINYLKNNFLIPLKKSIFETTNKELLLDFEIQNNEYYFLKNQEYFLKKHNVDNFYIFKYNSEIINKLDSFLNNKEDKFFYFWGNSGIGKSYLIAYFINKYIHTKKIIYLDTNEFIKKYYEFTKLKKNFLNLIRIFLTYELIIFDNFQSTKNKKKINEIFNLFFKDSANNKFIFISNIKQDIQKDLNSVSIFKINEPEEEDTKNIINNFLKNYDKNLIFSKEAISYLTEVLGNNIQVLIDKLLKIILILGKFETTKIIDIDDLNKPSIKSEIFNNNEKLLNFHNNQQIKIICKKLNFKPEELLENNRKKDIVLKRDIVIYILKKRLNISITNIGKMFNKNHSTIIHSLKKIEKKLENKDFKKYLDNFS
ncbi:hypothetical protein A6V39_02410 [Candidatus Mycoplasma haematobovis]|uniref:Chromosomal replication initiator DnaA C-terminal domain-containing protein n=1 Tax=Candidatus Mycoplasma haematobovis TaxID=432608 RepID=A0A1A9QDU4_9MOLU|nr:helix-turn-helix domain-containing protein [Candidatus Mycoplasma haematobovis]OAL10274.1 hypothetical protein A6V39_02410 [Candidatus Mycoplasma haematobovis]